MAQDPADGGRRTQARLNLSRARFVPDTRLGALLAYAHTLDEKLEGQRE